MPDQTVFISYSHSDEEFVDRLVADLRYSDIPATYDKWLLKVGDSIIERIAETVTQASHVIVVVSSASVESNWVRKELSLAMTGEVSGRKVKVLPVVINDCAIPPSITDKLYADCRKGYYKGFQRLIEAVDPQGDSRFLHGHSRWRSQDELEQGYEQLLAMQESNKLHGWIRENPHILVFLLGRRWALSEAISNFGYGQAQGLIDYLIVNGQSFQFEFQAVRLGPVCWSGTTRDQVLENADRLKAFIDNCHGNHDEFCRAASIRFSEHQIAPPSFMGYPNDARLKSRIFRIGGTIMLGRRSEQPLFENLRDEVAMRSEGDVEVASYDRLLDAIRTSRHE